MRRLCAKGERRRAKWVPGWGPGKSPGTRLKKSLKKRRHMVITDLNLENLSTAGWPGKIGPNISVTSADCPPLAQQADDGPLDVYLTASKGYGSGLVSCHRQISLLT